MKKWNMPIPNIAFTPPVYQCQRAVKPFVLDGNVEKEFWENAPFTEFFKDIEGDIRPKPHFKTRAKMLWDDENLYVGAILEGTEIWGELMERDCVIFYDNDFEIFLDPDSDTHQYFEFEMNARNTVWDLFLTKPYRDSGKPLNGWDIHGLQSAVKIDGELNNPAADNKRWMVEVVIPLKAIYEMAKEPRLPMLGEYYRMNFSRVQWDVDVKDGRYVKQKDEKTQQVLPERNWVWAPTGVVNIHYPELWGFLFFTEANETYEIPKREYVAWELRQVYYYQHKYHDRFGKFAEGLEELHMPGVLQGIEMEAGTYTFAASKECKEENVVLIITQDGKIDME